ncbi:MAG: hypothetical protein H0U43_00765 [Chthoniobacterales bacterium]|nr:hypothetical protein [Chthoniobacterales bacterium]
MSMAPLAEAWPADIEDAATTPTELTADTVEPSAKPSVTPSLFENASTYYDTGSKEFLRKNRRGVWLKLPSTDYKRVLRACGFSTKPQPGELLSAADHEILETQDKHDVAYAGPLAGYAEGFYEFGNHRVLVTNSPRLIEPIVGRWPILEQLLSNLFLVGAGVEQLLVFYGWIKVGFESLRAGERRPGQALVMAGPHNCGKSLLQNLLTEIFGGRFAKPYRYMTGQSAFNGDLFAAEHLTIEDEQPSIDLRARRNFGCQIKNFTVNEGQSCHAKYRDAVSLTPFWRVSISLNDEPENLLVLPPLDDSVQDKMIILQVGKHPMPMPTATLEQRKLFWGTLLGELPAFLYFLTQWRIPAGLSCPRFGVKHYHHPTLLEAMGSLAPEVRLLELIDAELFGFSEQTPWEGTALELQRLLTGSDCAMNHEARKLFYYNSACGTYMARLRRDHGERVSSRNTKTGTIWKIQPPDSGVTG